MAAQRLKPPSAKTPPPSPFPAWWSEAGTQAAAAETQKQDKAVQAAVASGMVSPSEVDTEISGADLKSSLAAIPGEIKGMIQGTPKSLFNLGGSLIGLGLGQPSEMAKKHGLGWAQNVPLVGFAFSKAGTEMAHSFKNTALDIYRAYRTDDFNYDPATKTWTPPKNVDRITQALREGRPIGALLVEDFGNVSLVGSAFTKGFGVQAAVSEAKMGQAAGSARTAASAEEAAAFTEQAGKFAEKAKAARERQAAAQKFTHATGMVGAAPILAYTIPIKGATKYGGMAGRSMAEFLRDRANTLEAAGVKTGVVDKLRKSADNFNRFFGTPMRDEMGNVKRDPTTGKPLIATRGAITQWAKDRLRQGEAIKQKIVRQGLNIMVKPHAYDVVNPTTGKPYGPLSAVEQEAVFAIRNGRARLLKHLTEALPEFSLEDIVRMGSRSRDQGFSLSNEGAQMAMAFENGLLDETQNRRISEAVGALDFFIEQYLGGPRRTGEGTTRRDPDTGELLRDPLDPYQDMPVPEMTKLQRALRDSPAQELADLFDRLIEQDLQNRAVDDPVRINLIAAIAEAAPDSVLSQLDIWPAKERNRVAEVLAIREDLAQRGAQEVIGTPPPEGGPGGAPRPLAEDPTTGLPTVEDIVAQKFPGQLPRYGMRYMLNSIKALAKLRGRAQALAEQILKSRVAIDAAERHIVTLSLQLQELEGFWLNRLGRRVEPNVKGELPKSAKRIEGLIAEARRLRDEQLALYQDMVAKQQDSVVVDGVVVPRETVASNVETLSEMVDTIEAQVTAFEQAASAMSELIDQLADHDAKVAAELNAEGVDAQALRATIENELSQIPADLVDMPRLGPDFAQADEILSTAFNTLEAFSRREDALTERIAALEEQHSEAISVLYDQTMQIKERRRLEAEIDDQYEPQINTLHEMLVQLDDVVTDAKLTATNQLVEYIASLDPARAAELADRLKILVDLIGKRTDDVQTMLGAEEFASTQKYLASATKMQEFYSQTFVPFITSVIAVAQPVGSPVVWPGQPFEGQPAAQAAIETPPAPEAATPTPEQQASTQAYNEAASRVASLETDLNNTQVTVARLKKIAETGSVTGAAQAEQPPAYGVEEINTVLQDEFKRGNVSSNKIKQFNDAATYSYEPPTDAKTAAKALESDIDGRLASTDPGTRAIIFVVDGELWYSNAYIMAKLPKTHHLYDKIVNSGEDPNGIWRSVASTKADVKKVSVVKVQEFTGGESLLKGADKAAKNTPAAEIVDSFIDTSGAKAVRLRSGDIEVTVQVNNLAPLLTPERTIHINPENPDRALVIKETTKGGKSEVVGMAMPLRNSPPPSLAERLKRAVQTTFKGNKERSVRDLIVGRIDASAAKPPVVTKDQPPRPTAEDIAAAEQDAQRLQSELNAAKKEAARLKPLAETTKPARAAKLKPVEPAVKPEGGRVITRAPGDEPIYLEYRGARYEVLFSEGKWDSRNMMYPAVIKIARVPGNIEDLVTQYRDATGINTDTAPFRSVVPTFSIKLNQPKRLSLTLDEQVIAKIEDAVRKDVDALALDPKYKPKDLQARNNEAQQLLEQTLADGGVKKQIRNARDSVRMEGYRGSAAQEFVRRVLMAAEGTIAKNKSRSKNSVLRTEIFPMERNLNALDAAIDHFDRTGNWMGATYGITGIEGLGVNYIANTGMREPLPKPLLGAAKGGSTDAFNVSGVREAAVAARDALAAQFEERVSTLTAAELSGLAKDTGKQAQAAASTDPPKTSALDPKSWVEMPDGTRRFETGTRTYSMETVDRPNQKSGKKLKDYVLKRIASDGLPIESTTMIFKTFAQLRKYVGETVSIDANMEAAYRGPKPTLELEPPKTPPWSKDLIDAEARLAKLEGRRVSLIRERKSTEKKLMRLRVRDAKNRALLPLVTSAQNRLEARLGREVVTQPGLTEVGGVEAPIEPTLGVRLRPTERNKRAMTNEDRARLEGLRAGQPSPSLEDPQLADEVARVTASLNEANLRRRQRVPISMAMRSSMTLPRREVPTGQQLPGRYNPMVEVYGSGYVPATGPRSGEPGPQRAYEEGLTGFRRLSSQRYRTGEYEEIYNLRTLIERTVSENRKMTQNESIIALMASQFAVRAIELLGDDLIAKIDKQAFDRVVKSYEEGGIDAYRPGRTDRESYFQYRVKQERGRLIREEMTSRGWETNPGEYKDIEAVRPDAEINAETRFLPKYVKTAVMRKTSFVDPSPAGLYLKAVQKSTTLFKNLTLPISITWQLGDIISTVLLSTLTGVPIRQLIDNLNLAYKENYGGGIKEIFKPEAERTVGKTGGFISESGLQDVGLRLEERAALQGLEGSAAKPFSHRIPVVGVVPRAYGWFRERAYRFNEFTNRIGRQAYFMSRLQQSLDNYNAAELAVNPDHQNVTMETIVDTRIDQTNAEIGRLFWDTVNQANDVMGDWMDLTPWERRYVMPHVTFYAWVKHINKLFAKLSMNDPSKIMWYMYLGQMAYDPDTDPFGLLAGYTPGIGGMLSRVDFAGPFSDVAQGVPFNVFQQVASGQASSSTLDPLASLLAPAPRLIGAAVGKSFKGGINDLDRPPGSGAINEQGREVSPSLLSPGRLGELAGVTIDTFPLLRKLADLAPTGKIPFTDVQLGPYKTYETGYARTIPGTNVKVEKPMGRAGALLNLFNVPFRPQKTERQIIEEQIQAIKNIQSFEKQKARLKALGG